MHILITLSRTRFGIKNYLQSSIVLVSIQDSLYSFLDTELLASGHHFQHLKSDENLINDYPLYYLECLFCFMDFHYKLQTGNQFATSHPHPHKTHTASMKYLENIFRKRHDKALI